VHAEGLRPRLVRCASTAVEVAYVADQVEAWLSSHVTIGDGAFGSSHKRPLRCSDVAVVAFSHYELDAFEKALAGKGLKCRRRKDVTSAGADCADAVALGTIHSVKGWEASLIFLVGLHRPTATISAGRAHGWRKFSLKPEDAATPEAIEEVQEQLRLLYVGATRARRFLSLSSAEKAADERKQLALIQGGGDGTMALAQSQPAALQQLQGFAAEAECHTVGSESELPALRPASGTQLD